MSKRVVGSIFFLAFLLGAQPAVGDVINGGFETGDFTGWTLSGNNPYPFVAPNPSNIAGPGHSGGFFAFLAALPDPGFLSQTLATTPGTEFALSFWLRNNANGTFEFFRVTWDGNVLLNLVTGAVPGAPYINFTFNNLLATQSSTDLRFQFLADPDHAFSLDDVSVVGPAGGGGAPIPEPGTLPLLGTGLLLGATGYGRRKRSPAS